MELRTENMFINPLILYTGQVFGKIPWIYDGKNKLIAQFSKIYPSIVATIIFLYYILKVDKFKSKLLDKQKIVRYFNNIFTIIFYSYISRNEWKKWFQLWRAMDTSLELNLTRSTSFRLKLNGIVLVNTVVFLTFRIHRYFKSNNTDILNGVILYISLFGKFSPLIFSTILQECFKIINKYWRNIYKWHKMGLKIKRGKDTAFCKNQYKHVYEMYLSYQKIFGWIIALSLLELIGTIIFFSNSIVVTDAGKDVKILNFFLTLGSHTQFLVSISVPNFVEFIQKL